MSETLLHVRNLRYRYGDGTDALRGIDLAVATGERVGLVGPNGSGKSTLLLCISGLYVGEGTIRLDGDELTPARADVVRGRVGLVFQSADDQLFMPTLAEDLAFGPINLGCPHGEVQQRVRQVAERMALTPVLDRPPHHLSMGRRRDAAIAAVLTMQPALLLMDEPSSNLDPRSRQRLIDVLSGLETTLLIASHDMALVGRLCDRVAVIDEGRIVAEGAAAEVLSDAALMEPHGLEVWQDPRAQA